jgi:hypothetical protein
MSNERVRELVERITSYLSSGGLNNPEMAQHRVRDLLIDCRAALAEPARDPMARLVTSDHAVDGIDPADLTKKISYDFNGDGKMTANVGAWYHTAVYWKWKALIGSDATNSLPFVPSLASVCPTHHEQMTIYFYDRPGSSPGNAMVCRSCIADREQSLKGQP